MLMVCANIGNLLLARASAREREFAVRAALGASRLRVARRLLAESLLLASIGGALGLALASWGVAALRMLAPASLPRVDNIGINGSVAAFDISATLIAGFLCGMMPALQSGRRDLHAALNDETRASAGGVRLRGRSVLVVAETALGVVVLVCAGLLFRSVVRLTEVPIGFKPGGVLTFRVVLPDARYRSEPQRTAFYHQLAERVQAMPGAISAAAISFLPGHPHRPWRAAWRAHETRARPRRAADDHRPRRGYRRGIRADERDVHAALWCWCARSDHVCERRHAVHRCLARRVVHPGVSCDARRSDDCSQAGLRTHAKAIAVAGLPLPEWARLMTASQQRVSFVKAATGS
jgi:hypothetical protein